MGQTYAEWAEGHRQLPDRILVATRGRIRESD